jgi:hypothetical protein
MLAHANKRKQLAGVIEISMVFSRVQYSPTPANVPQLLEIHLAAVEKPEQNG